MVAEAIDITRETYFCILMDREFNGPVIVASPDGGVDIEEVAEKTPQRIKKIPVDINTGCTEAIASEVAEFLEFKGEMKAKCADQVKRLFDMFMKVDCLQLEVKEAFRIISEDKNVKAILVNVFGGIVDCSIIANGVVNASNSLSLKIPLIVRLEGQNVEQAKQILKDSGLDIMSAKDLDDAAKKAVDAL